MARTLLTWRWAAATVLLVAAVLAMVLLGGWQWQRSVPEPARADVDLDQVEPAALPDVTAVAGRPGDGVVVPDGATGELVVVQGRWRPERTLLVADRERDGRPGRWVVTGVELADGRGLVPVVRGWVPAGTRPEDVPAPAPGTARLVAWVEQSEPLDIPVEVLQPDGVVALLSTADLANRWPEDLVPGFTVLAPTADQVEAGQVEAAGPAGPVPLVEPPTEATEARDWRNLAYSAQWFVFAAFAVVLWWRMLRDDVARRSATAAAPEHPQPVERSTT